MCDAEDKNQRVFKTSWFAKRAKKARIKDDKLCTAIQEVMLGQADDLGGGVFKKRLNENMHRGIVLTKTGKFWVYEYLFAKNDRENIDANELEDFKKLVDGYKALTNQQLEQLVKEKKLLEICNDEKDKIQE